MTEREHQGWTATPGRGPNAPGGRVPPSADAPWGALIPDDQWAMFACGVDALEAEKIPFILHGALGFASYTGRFRNTKDVDVVVHARDHERAIAALKRACFGDYFEKEGYDRSWIFRAHQEAGIFDVIWALPNHRVEIDEPWFERARPFRLRGREFRAAPAEEIMRVKLYVMQRGRCDWPDVLNILAATVEQVDWHWLVKRMGRDVSLLHGLLAVFNWLCPRRARALPGWVRAQFALPDIPPDDPDADEVHRAALFESRPWFALHQPADRMLER